MADFMMAFIMLMISPDPSQHFNFDAKCKVGGCFRAGWKTEGSVKESNQIYKIDVTCNKSNCLKFGWVAHDNFDYDYKIECKGGDCEFQGLTVTKSKNGISKTYPVECYDGKSCFKHGAWGGEAAVAIPCDYGSCDVTGAKGYAYKRSCLEFWCKGLNCRSFGWNGKAYPCNNP